MTAYCKERIEGMSDVFKEWARNIFVMGELDNPQYKQDLEIAWKAGLAAERERITAAVKEIPPWSVCDGDGHVVVRLADVLKVVNGKEKETANV